MTRGFFLRMACLYSAWFGWALVSPGHAAGPVTPVVIGITAEFGVQGSHAAQSIEKGIRLAIDEINTAGGVLGGRPLALEVRDDRGVPARGIDNFTEFAAQPDVVAVFCGRFSPVALEIAPLAGKLRLPFLDPWAAADGITRQPEPNYVFRLSLIDSWAMETMLDYARARGFERVALFVPNTAWGRSNEAALLAYAKRHARLSHQTFWYNWGDTEFAELLAQAQANGAQALVMVANEFEGLPIVKLMAAQPEASRLPIISHWGLLGGDFAAKARAALERVDFAVVHTFSFSDPHSPRAAAVAAGVKRLFGVDAEALRGQVGFAHAYDMTHLLAKAIAKAGTSDRSAIRNALERLDAHEGLLRRYAPPFTASRHEALDRSQVVMARFDKEGRLKSIPRK
jgi:branched-chain amino acid transport system substrate-binding protein